MKFYRIGYFRAALRGHPLSTYIAISDGSTLYLTERQHKNLSSSIDNYRGKIENLEEVLTRASKIQDLIERENEELRTDVSGTKRRLDLVRRKNRRMREKIQVIKESEENLKNQISNLRNGNFFEEISKEMDTHEQKYASDFLKSAVPAKRNGTIRSHDVEHHRTRRFRKLRKCLDGIPYISQIHWNAKARGNHTGVSGIDQDNGTYNVYVNYREGDFFTRMKITTTAETPLQAEYIKWMIEKVLEKF